MPGISRRPYPLSARRLLREDDGFALIEVMVSAVLLIVLALATLKLIDSSQLSSSQLRSKGVASALAAADLNRLRQTKFATASNFTTTSSPQQIDGVTYTVVSSGTWTSSAGMLNTCTTSATGSPGQYVRLTSTVTWPSMGNVKPVTAETLLVPRAGEVPITAGNFTMKVVTMAGVAVPGVSVSMNGQTLTTSAAGCVLFTGIAPGTYPVTYFKSNYIDTTRAATGTYSAKVTAGDTASKTVLYDQPAYITPVTYYLEDAAGAPTTTASTWSSYSVAPAQGTTIGPATSTTKLFPWSGGYQVYAGDCVGNNPTNYNAAYATAFPLSTVAPGPTQTLGAAAYLQTASITVTGLAAKAAVTGILLPNTATTAMASGCDPSASLSRTAASTGSNLSVTFTWDVPYGVYSYCLASGGKRLLQTSASSAYNNTPVGGTPTPSAATFSVPYSSFTTGSCTGATG